MFAVGKVFPFTLDHSERRDDLLAGFRRINHCIYNSSLGGDVGVCILFGVIIDEFSFTRVRVRGLL